MENQTIIKECEKHGQTIYSLRSDKKYRCRKCCTEAVKRRREKIKIQAIEYKGGSCNICTYNRSVSALEFHHLDPKEKDFGIGEKGYTRSWNKVKKELDKCILVCANCHREIHEGLINLNNYS